MNKRYRFNGKERDEETGLYDYGARYYAAWLARWTSADPLGIGADGPGVYNYTRGSPVTMVDPNGTEEKDPLAPAPSFLNDPWGFLEWRLDETIEAGPMEFVEGMGEKMMRLPEAVASPFISTWAPDGMLDRAARKGVHEFVLDEPYREFITPEEHEKMGRDALDVTLFLYPNIPVPSGPRNFALAPIPVGADAALTPGLAIGLAQPLATEVPGFIVGATLSFSVGDNNNSKQDAGVAPVEAQDIPKVPQGYSEAQFDEFSKTARGGTSQFGNNIAVHGSRANGTARPTSDIDVAILVSDEQFEQIVQQRFGTPNPGSAKEKTMLHAIKMGKIQAGEAGLRGLRRSLEAIAGTEVDISVVRIGGPLDQGPYIPLK